MALEKSTLKEKIEEAFKKAKETAPPKDPETADDVQKKILAQLAVDLSEAIDAFVKSGAVVGITVEVKNDNNVRLGTGTQIGTGKVQ